MASLATLDQLRAFLRVPGTLGEPELPGDADATADDIAMFLALSSASDAVRNSANRTFEVAGNATLRTFTPYQAREFSALNWVFDPFKSVWQISKPKVFIDDLTDLTGLAIVNRISGVDITSSFDRGWPYNAASKGKPFVALEFVAGTAMPFEVGSLEITAKWGWSAVPDTIVNATLIQASRFYKRRDAPFGVAGSDAMGNSMRLLAKVDPDVAVMISSYSRIWGAV
jgi:hypothetical protein